MPRRLWRSYASSRCVGLNWGGNTYLDKNKEKDAKYKSLNKETRPTTNVFEHEFVPKHIILSKGEVEKLLETYKIRPFQLPKIKDTDPVVKALNAKHGDILKIIRQSPTAGEADYYRCVVGEK